jgi:hypothetical protein
VFNAELFDKFKHEAEEVRKIKHDLDIRIIGSDISIKAIDTASKNMQFANIDSYLPLFRCHDNEVINDPMIFAEHWPKHNEAGSSSLINFKEARRNTYLSLYHGDFNVIGQRLRVQTNNFEDFTLLMNIPYGH